MIGDEPQFTQSELVELFELSPVTIQGWVNRRLIELKGGQNPGRAGRRFYAPSDVVKLVAMQHLTSLGISAGEAARIANKHFMECFERLDSSTQESPKSCAHPYTIMRIFSDTDEGHGHVWSVGKGEDPFLGDPRYADKFMYIHIDITKTIRSVISKLFDRVLDEVAHEL